jgi:hypothetical protein
MYAAILEAGLSRLGVQFRRRGDWWLGSLDGAQAHVELAQNWLVRKNSRQRSCAWLLNRIPLGFKARSQPLLRRLYFPASQINLAHVAFAIDHCPIPNSVHAFFQSQTKQQAGPLFVYEEN